RTLWSHCDPVSIFLICASTFLPEMTLKDSFMRATLLMRIAVIVAVVAQACSWVSFTTTSWSRGYFDPLEGRSLPYIGLWRSCSYSPPKFASGCNFLDGTPSDALAMTQAFGIVGFVGLNLGFLLVVLKIFTDKLKGNSESLLIAGISMIVSAISWFLAFIIFLIMYAPSSSLLGYSFLLAGCSFILAAVAGVLVLCARS
ncbi:epithelial membrane protein 2, partial [Biomphalaria pfeifferi]